MSLTKRAPDWKFFLNTWIWLSFSTFGGLKKYPKISGYLDRISKIWIMKKIDIQSIQVSMYPKKTDIHVSKYPCIHDIQVSTYPSIQLSKKNRYPRYPSIRISEKSGIRPSLLVPPLVPTALESSCSLVIISRVAANFPSLLAQLGVP